MPTAVAGRPKLLVVKILELIRKDFITRKCNLLFGLCEGCRFFDSLTSHKTDGFVDEKSVSSRKLNIVEFKIEQEEIIFSFRETEQRV
jgi:hypothetical protein